MISEKYYKVEYDWLDNGSCKVTVRHNVTGEKLVNSVLPNKIDSFVSECILKIGRIYLKVENLESGLMCGRESSYREFKDKVTGISVSAKRDSNDMQLNKDLLDELASKIYEFKNA